MATIVVTIVETVGKRLGEFIAEQIMPLFRYLCCFQSYIDDLKEEARHLRAVRDDLTKKVDTAKDKGDEILTEVKTWLEKANEVLAKVDEIESESESGSLTVESRCSLSKKAKETTEAMKDLQDRHHKFNNVICQAARPAAALPIPLEPTDPFQSRKKIEEEIMKALREKEVSIFGICGMGGVGKTTMADRVKYRAKEKERLFDETVKIVVSQNIDMSKIQNEMAAQLGLELKEEDLQCRKSRLYTRLTGGKRILIVLDDVWRELELKDLGISSEIGLKGCKVLLTSRDKGVLNKMGARKPCEIDSLTEGEAWSLFKEKVGNCVDDDYELNSIARKVAGECKGLPIALVTVGVALQDQKNIYIWKDVLKQLKDSNPEYMPQVLDGVYKPLKVSYDKLEVEHAKSLFLLCCLYPEDANIPINELTFYVKGLGMLERITSFEEARNRICFLVEMLKNRFLLLDGSSEYHSQWRKGYRPGFRKEYYVRMHDVVRDVAIFIATEERRIKCRDCARRIKCRHCTCTWISSFLGERFELSKGSNFPNLNLLLIDNSAGEGLQINDNFFEGMIELNVLSVSYCSLGSLILKNLRTLLLYSCGRSLESMSVVGGLVNLEILICRGCFSIEELPSEMKGLKCLRVLELFRCPNLETIVPGVISSLTELQELTILKSFDKWEAEDNEERTNARLSELESLSNLTRLEIEVEDSTLAAQNINLPSNIVRFYIAIGGIKQWAYDTHVWGFDDKIMNLELQGEISLGDWIYLPLLSTEYLRLVGDGLNNLDLAKVQQWRSLTLKNCSTMKRLVNTTTPVFPHLVSLDLDNLPSLEELCNVNGPIPDQGSSKPSTHLKNLKLQMLPALKHLWKPPCQNVLSNLSSIDISGCRSLRNLFSLATARDCPLQLENLRIGSCRMMEQVFMWNQEENQTDDVESRFAFPKLKSLGLGGLRSLTTFCKGMDKIEFPLLSELRIRCCPQLKSLVSSTTPLSGYENNQNNSDINHDGHDDDQDSLHLFCKPKVEFGSLKELDVRYEEFSCRMLWCNQIPITFFTGLEILTIEIRDSIMSVFSSSIAQNLLKLKELNINCCHKLVTVIEEEEKDARGGETTDLFPCLEKLRLFWLPELKSFCEWSCDLMWPSLKNVYISDCPKIERFSLGSLTTPNLEEITGEHEDIIINTNEDLNDALQHHLLKVKEEKEKNKREEKEKEKEEEEEREEEEEEEEVVEEEDQKRKGEIEEEEI